MKLPLLLAAALATAAGAASVSFAAAQDATPAPRPAALSDRLPVPDAPEVTGKAWVLMDYATGQLLASHNPDMRVEPASITKVMTSYVIAAEMKAGKIKDTDPGKSPPAPVEKPAPNIPLKYRQEGTTPLKTTVKGGKNEFNIEMKP